MATTVHTLQISMTIIAAELGAGGVLKESDVTLIFVFLVLFAVVRALWRLSVAWRV